jgi:hypothetical protein
MEIPIGDPFIELDNKGEKRVSSDGGCVYYCVFGYWGGVARPKELWPNIGEHGRAASVFTSHGDLCADFHSNIDGTICDWCDIAATHRLGRKAVACTAHFYSVGEKMRRLRRAESSGSGEEVLQRLRQEVNLLK